MEKPFAAFDNVPAVLDCRREKRLLYALDRDPSEKISSNKKQPCQEWNFDLHDDSPQFPLNSYHGKACAKLSLMLERQTNDANQQIFMAATPASRCCDEGKCRAIGTSRNSGLVTRFLVRIKKIRLRAQSRTNRRKENVPQLSPAHTRHEAS
jgi:hypothetical protein